MTATMPRTPSPSHAAGSGQATGSGQVEGPVPPSRDQLLALAQECADYIVARNPYVRLVAVSGSLCRPEHEGAHEDIDFFVVTERGRIWEAFLGCLLHGWRFARARSLDRTFFCFNYLVDEAHPEEIDLRRREYAREFLNLRVLHGPEEYARLFQVHQARLRQAQPQLYEIVASQIDVGAHRTAHSDSPSPSTGRGPGGGVHAFYRLAAPAFRLLAKWMEARRRRLYPGGYVYSNSRVIRSHFRRGWHNDAAEEDGLPVARAFDAVAHTYEAEVESTPANAYMQAEVYGELRRVVGPGMRVLDLGCGTGRDAVWLARHGASVLALDVSERMVEQARARVEHEGFDGQIEVRRLAIENLSTLLPDHAHSFDVILSNFGALNMAGDPSVWSPVLARLLKPDGRLVATVMSRWCLPEVAASLLRLRPGFAVRRARGEPIDVGGVPLRAAMYNPGDFARRLRHGFALVSVRGLCVVFPPPTLEASAGRLTGSRVLLLADRVLGRLPLLRGLGDHFLAVMRPSTGGYTLFESGAPITASPVVTDLNGDGAPEVIVAADRLWVLDTHGAPLHGWPRKASKPLASTAGVVREGELTRIYAGSDDHQLHAFDLGGRRLPGFPYPTAGDVFSSPWVGHLSPGDSRDLVFGSDDGFIYAINESGRLRGGWPVHTNGYVSASPTVGVTPGGSAVFVGSWDGRLYGLDANGVTLAGWPRRLGFPIWGTVALADIDGDGHAEVIVGAHRLFAYRGNGEAIPGFPVRLAGYAVGSPAVGDIDGDGRPEVVIASDELYAVRGDGSAVPGFPVELGAHVWASPLLIDVNGDGHAEVVIADMTGNVWAVDGRGRVLDGWPKRAGKRIAATPTAADIDNDGYLELLVATWEGRVIAYKTEARADDTAASPWRTFPRRDVCEAPLLIGPAKLSDDSAAHPVPSPTGRGLGRGPASVSTNPSTPRPFRVTDVHLQLTDSPDIEAGLLYYELDGKPHPSPLLGSDGRYFAIVQPLRPLKTIDLHFELLTTAGEAVRVPQAGAYRLTIGRPGLRRVEEH